MYPPYNFILFLYLCNLEYCFARYEYEDRGSRYRNIEYRMAADDPRFDPQVDLRTRLEQLRPLIASANLINYRFGRKVNTYNIMFY